MFAFKKVQKSFPASLFIALVGTKELFTSILVNTGGCFLCHDPYDTGNIKTEIDRARIEIGTEKIATVFGFYLL